jgi:hypothetical protein
MKQLGRRWMGGWSECAVVEEDKSRGREGCDGTFRGRALPSRESSTISRFWQAPGPNMNEWIGNGGLG